MKKEKRLNQRKRRRGKEKYRIYGVKDKQKKKKKKENGKIVKEERKKGEMLDKHIRIVEDSD